MAISLSWFVFFFPLGREPPDHAVSHPTGHRLPIATARSRRDAAVPSRRHFPSDYRPFSSSRVSLESVSRALTLA